MEKHIYLLLFSWFCGLACFAQTPQKTTYTYDALNRLTEVIYANGNSITYNYDVLGNRTSVVVSGTSCQAATATLSGTQTINAGQPANLSVSFTGDAPYTLMMNGQTYSGITSSPYIIPVSPTSTTTYTLTSVSNGCGAGTVSGSAIVTVTPVSSGEVYSIKTGSWHDPTTWYCNCVPNNTHTVEIKQNHTVTVSTGDANLKNLKYSGGYLTFQNQKKLCFGCGFDLTAGLSAYYPFNGNANDESGNGNHGVVNGATLSADRFGVASKAYSFDGNDGITSMVNSSFNFQEMTISMWVQLQVDAYPTLISLGPTDLTKDEYWFMYSAGLLVFYSGRDQRLTSNAFFSNGPNWKHICILYKPNSVRLFINGQLDSESRPATWSIPTFTGNALLQMGTRGPRGASLQGKLDDVRIYNRAVSDAEVTNLYNVEKQ